MPCRASHCAAAVSFTSLTGPHRDTLSTFQRTNSVDLKVEYIFIRLGIVRKNIFDTGNIISPHYLVAIFIPCIQETTCKLEGQQHNNNQQRDNSSVTGGGSCVATSEQGVTENPRHQRRERAEVGVTEGRNWSLRDTNAASCSENALIRSLCVVRAILSISCDDQKSLIFFLIMLMKRDGDAFVIFLHYLQCRYLLQKLHFYSVDSTGPGIIHSGIIISSICQCGIQGSFTLVWSDGQDYLNNTSSSCVMYTTPFRHLSLHLSRPCNTAVEGCSAASL